MTDIFSSAQRSYCMSRIRSRNTKPEMEVRRFLWANGFRYRLHRRGLPGTPDIVISRLRTVIFINGCFWHGHSCQSHFPKTNEAFWSRKIERNKARDIENGIRLRQMEWNVITIWECELRRATKQRTLAQLLKTLRAIEQVSVRDVPKDAVYRYTYPGEEYNPAVAEPGEDTYEALAVKPYTFDQETGSDCAAEPEEGVSKPRI